MLKPITNCVEQWNNRKGKPSEKNAPGEPNQTTTSLVFAFASCPANVKQSMKQKCKWIWV